MVATNLKAETFSLREQRDAIEIQMNAIIERLCGPEGPGITGNLVDAEGFPRSDIDIPMVRAERRRLAELRNDYKDITEKISKNLELLHSARLAPKVPVPSSNQETQESQGVAPFVLLHGGSSEPSAVAMDVEPISNVPFAAVDEITDGSPAAAAGIQLGDQIVKFGNVEIGEDLLRRLASEAQSNQGLAVPVVVLRQGTLINLSVTPRPWNGRGLLGCHFTIL
ncbi:hypothetical protein H6P81_000372 [Aristolochia fimbriata]|uniref:26S proteasome non-ATPase regulatory subunit 9 n=1 Tax=Aristolochia fimbriata TaxID=158543 RepID=A0AAV7F4N6_ARIFI|nr:hypothetical protein H6P81_000372 [Aristolochia fimbriata]